MQDFFFLPGYLDRCRIPAFIFGGKIQSESKPTGAEKTAKPNHYHGNPKPSFFMYWGFKTFILSWFWGPRVADTEIGLAAKLGYPWVFSLSFFFVFFPRHLDQDGSGSLSYPELRRACRRRNTTPHWHKGLVFWHFLRTKQQALQNECACGRFNENDLEVLGWMRFFLYILSIFFGWNGLKPQATFWHECVVFFLFLSICSTSFQKNK